MTTFDPISGAPISSLGVYLSQEVTQSLGLSASLAIIVDHNTILDHTLSLSDSLGLNTVLNQSVSDSISFSDSVTTALVYLREVSETYTLSASVNVQFIDNTEPYETLALSHEVVVNAIRLILISDTLDLTDLAVRVKAYDLSDTITFSQLLEKITPEVSVASTLSLSQNIIAGLTINLALAHSLVLTQLLYRNLSKELVQTLSFTSTIDARNLPYFDFTDTITFIQGVDYLTNLDAFNAGSLQLNQTVDLVLFPAQSLIQTLSLSQSADVYNFAQQNMVGDLTLIAENAYTLFEQQDLLNLLTLSHLIEPRNLAQQNDPNTLALSHSVTVLIGLSGFQEVSNALNLQQSVNVGQVKLFEICHCLELVGSAYKAIELEISHDLDLSHSYVPGQPVSDLVLSHDVSINATFDECCGTVFVQDKITKNSLALTHSVSLNHGSVFNLAGTLTLSQTAAYYVL